MDCLPYLLLRRECAPVAIDIRQVGIHILRHREQAAFELRLSQRKGICHVESMPRPSCTEYIMIFLSRVDLTYQAQERIDQAQIRLQQCG